MTENNHHVFIFFGLVGAGKGTQVSLLEDYFKEKGENILHISTGAEYRKLLEKEDFFSTLAKKVLNGGNLMPNSITNSVTINHLLQHYTGAEHLFFDGYPRSLNQAEAFMDLVDFFGWDQAHIVFLNIDEDEAVKRMKLRGREDDNEEGVRKRIQVYKEEVLPSIEYLQQHGNFDFHEINGVGEIESIHETIKSKLGLA